MSGVLVGLGLIVVLVVRLGLAVLGRDSIDVPTAMEWALDVAILVLAVTFAYRIRRELL